MANILSDLRNFWSIRQLYRGESAFTDNTSLLSNYNFNAGRPSWIALSDPKHFEKAARFNPIVKAAINLLATSSANGKKIAVDIKTGEEIPWNEGNEGVQKAFKLLVERPNPLQSASEFAFQGTFFLKVFGNRYVYVSMPIGFDQEIDILNVNTLFNLPSQFVKVNTTGKIYDQTELSGIISEYAMTDINPVVKYSPNEIIHFNEVNISSDFTSVMGISKLEVLKMPITNTQLAFEAMNTILASRGMQGIISSAKKDGQGSLALTSNEKKEIDDKFKEDYGLRTGQNPFWITPAAINYIKTAMSSKDIGIYEEFSNNSILISNEFGVPPELVKTYIAGATYENQQQAVKRLYQDTTIPMVADEDQYWSNRLNTAKYGFKLNTKWDHVPALQDAFKEKAMALNLDARTAEAAYNNNIITKNQYLSFLGLPPIKDGDKLRNEFEGGSNNEE